MPELSDQELVENYLSGEGTALDILVAHYLKPIFAFIYRFAGALNYTEDITQEVFIKVWKNLKKFDRTKSFKTWIFKIARNTAIDFLRQKKDLPFSDFETEEGNVIIDTLVDPEPLPEELLDRENLSSEVEALIQKLAPATRAVLLLHYQEQLTFQEIAEVLDEPLNTVKSRHLRAINYLREKLGADLRTKSLV